MSKSVQLYEVSDLMVQVLQGGGEVAFVTGGVSMMPMLRNRTDKVVLVKPSGKLKKNDVPLFTRADGSFVLHRVVGIDGEGYVLRGDNQLYCEHGVKDEQVIAVVKSYYRDGKHIECSSLRYKAYCDALPLIRFWKFKIYPHYAKIMQKLVSNKNSSQRK